MHPLIRHLAAPRTQIWVHGCLFSFFVILIPPTVALWSHSVPYIAYLSVYAIIASHWVGLVAALSWLSSKRIEDERPTPAPRAAPIVAIVAVVVGLSLARWVIRRWRGG